MSLPTAAELRVRIDAKLRADYLASQAKTTARKAEVEATAYLRLTSMIEEMSAGCSTLAITRLDASDEAEALTAQATALGYTVTTRYDDDLARDGQPARRRFVVSVSALEVAPQQPPKPHRESCLVEAHMAVILGPSGARTQY